MKNIYQLVGIDGAKISWFCNLKIKINSSEREKDVLLPTFSKAKNIS